MAVAGGAAVLARHALQRSGNQEAAPSKLALKPSNKTNLEQTADQFKQYAEAVERRSKERTQKLVEEHEQLKAQRKAQEESREKKEKTPDVDHAAKFAAEGEKVEKQRQASVRESQKRKQEEAEKRRMQNRARIKHGRRHKQKGVPIDQAGDLF